MVSTMFFFRGLEKSIEYYFLHKKVMKHFLPNTIKKKGNETKYVFFMALT